MTEADRRDEVAREWCRALIGTSYVPMSRPEITGFLGDCMERLINSLGADESVREVAESVGAELVRAHFSSPVALNRTVRLLAIELPGMVHPNDRSASEGNGARLGALLGSLAAGYCAEQHHTTLAQQEVIKHAVLRARDAAEAALAASEARFRAVFSSSALGIAVSSLDGVLEDVNSALARIFRSGCASLRGASLYDLVDESWSQELRSSEADLVAGELEQFQVKTRFCAEDGTQIWTQISASLVRDASGAPDYQVLLYEDITEQHMLQETMHRQATQDPLTGLANRTLLRSRMDTAVRESYPGRRVGLCYFDLDGFKAVNDSLGHLVGDKLLRIVAQRLESFATSEGALAARMGGDEFVVLLPDSSGTKAMVGMVERILDELTRPAKVGDHELNVQASAGIVEYEATRTTSEQLLRDADITLYRAKSEGKAQWVLFESELNELSRHRFQLSTAMPAALEDNEFFVEYWPVMLLDGSKLCTIEANVRWDHPEFGELDAADFLGLAQETGLIIKLGNWVLRQVCTHAKRLHDRFGSAAPVVAVNMSKRHFRDPDLVGDVRDILYETGLPASQLRLVVVEDALTDDQDEPLDVLDIFSEMGVLLGVLDFGGSFTRLAKLRSMAVSAVKISASYLPDGSPEAGSARKASSNPDSSDIGDPLNQHIVSSLVTAAHLLGLYVVADGVHTDEQAAWLHELGVYAGLGTFTGGLASALEIEAMIAQGELTVG